jgi:CCR4-NOT transcription complex subunit 1
LASSQAGKARSRELLLRVWSAAPPEVLMDLLVELYAQVGG